MASIVPSRARLSHVIVQIDDIVKREVCEFVPGKGIVRRMEDQPGGFIVYCPKGHVVRLNEEKLRHYGLNKKPKIVDMSDVHDPNSPVGKVFFGQESEDRAAGMTALEDEVIALATAKTGDKVFPEQHGKTAASEVVDDALIDFRSGSLDDVMVARAEKIKPSRRKTLAAIEED